MNVPALQVQGDNSGIINTYYRIIPPTVSFKQSHVHRGRDNSTRSDIAKDALRDKFLALADQWTNETGHLSNMLHKHMNKNYQQIISKGEGIVPLILEELKKRPSHWFWALEMITNENPVKQEHVGRIDLMARDWVEWGRNKGYLLT